MFQNMKTKRIPRRLKKEHKKFLVLTYKIEEQITFEELQKTISKLMLPCTPTRVKND